MKSKNLLLLVAILLTILAVPSCNFVDVDTPVNNDIQKYRIHGIVQTADQSTVIEGAKVILGNLETITNAEGKYSFESVTSFASGTEIFVSKEGYINSFMSLAYGDEAPIEFELHFSLTRALPAGFVDLSQGGVLTFEDVTITIPGGNSATLNGETMQVVQLSVTPLSPISSYGSFNGATFKTLVFNPLGMEFSKPITVSFKLPEGVSTGNLAISQYNTETSEWENTSINVEYDAASGISSFQVKETGIFKGNDPASLLITDIAYFTDEPLRYFKSNCECEQPTYWSGGYYVKRYELSTTSTGSPATYDELKMYGFFGQASPAQIPYITAYIPGYYGQYWIGQPVGPVFNNIFVDQCKAKEIFVVVYYVQVTGSYIFNNEYKEFVFKYYFGNTPNYIYDVPCTVHNACHQGCN